MIYVLPQTLLLLSRSFYDKIGLHLVLWIKFSLIIDGPIQFHNLIFASKTKPFRCIYFCFLCRVNILTLFMSRLRNLARCAEYLTAFLGILTQDLNEVFMKIHTTISIIIFHLINWKLWTRIGLISLTQGAVPIWIIPASREMWDMCLNL